MAETKIFGITINLDQLKNIPDVYKIVTGAVVAGLILVGAGYYLVYPVYVEYEVLVQDNDKLSQENQTMEAKLGYEPNLRRYIRIDEIETEMKQLEKEIKEVQVRIPTKENIPTLIYDLERIAEENNKSDLFDIVPAAMQSVSLPASLQGGAATGLDLKQVALSLNVESDYPTMINLFKDFERYQRAIATTSVSLSPQGPGKNKFNTLRVALNMKAYVLPEGGQ